MTEELLQSLTEDPMAVLNRGYRAKERIAARQKRIEEWRQIAESITSESRERFKRQRLSRKQD